ncbi:hypothetical protein [Bradyrhizobium sp. 2S1]|uniref:hypothetical protein n=1 Tax=Bradyrhizobium sp. 2S1 TaxID=1404429 RepID=UPI0014094A14|nr:hypothetical protein [Bradyrhizobium sp. 2S1]MCK7672339.1 hypothetical protein [Bradyrhizobium sp. 2S1]
MAGTTSRPFCLLRDHHAETAARNALFTIFVDRMFTTFMRRAFTKARDATRQDSAIA